jgi:hypothetical protein
MTDLDLIDWTIQEAKHLTTEGREVSDPDGTTSLDRLLAVLEREPVERPSPEDPVASLKSSTLLAFSWPPKARQSPHVLKSLPHPNRTSFCRPQRSLRRRRTVGSMRKCPTS